MENFYTAYTKTIDNTTYYFVKKFMVIPELPDVDPILETYGMHAEFSKACKIAGVNDIQVKERLLKEANATLKIAKVIDFDSISFSEKNLAM